MQSKIFIQPLKTTMQIWRPTFVPPKVFHGKCVDWAIHELVGDDLVHHWYQSLGKNHGFVVNIKQEFFFINVFLKIKMIPDACVTLLTNNFEVALITSKKWFHKKYLVHNPKFEWASCDYSYTLWEHLQTPSQNVPTSSS